MAFSPVGYRLGNLQLSHSISLISCCYGSKKAICKDRLFNSVFAIHTITYTYYFNHFFRQNVSEMLILVKKVFSKTVLRKVKEEEEFQRQYRNQLLTHTIRLPCVHLQLNK